MQGKVVTTETSHRYYILDIDGTLLPTADVDNRGFWAAVGQVFGRGQRARTLTGYRNITDIGILEQWCEEQIGRAPEADEVEAVELGFLEQLQQFTQSHPDHFKPRRGVLDWLHQCQAEPSISLALATGGWERTASFKLEISGLQQFGLPMSSCNESRERTRIMGHALDQLSRTQARAPCGHHVTYFGDGTWDAHSSHQLGWNFVGIASGTAAQRLREAGATSINEDFDALL
jgi:phosphoglycolate phosphatase-like HAD superfamily hydrolase